MKNWPFVCLTDLECKILSASEYSMTTILNWKTQRRRPWPRHYRNICAILGRDVAKPMGDSPLPIPAPIPAGTSVSVTGPRLTVNACEHDELCIPVRRIAFQGIPGTLEDQRRQIPCANCKRGVERERRIAAEKKAPVEDLRKSKVCACGNPKSWGTRTCMDCRDEARRATA